jgi:hypothetical protein
VLHLKGHAAQDWGPEITGVEEHEWSEKRIDSDEENEESDSNSDDECESASESDSESHVGDQENENDEEEEHGEEYVEESDTLSVYSTTSTASTSRQ